MKRVKKVLYFIFLVSLNASIQNLCAADSSRKHSPRKPSSTPTLPHILPATTPPKNPLGAPEEEPRRNALPFIHRAASPERQAPTIIVSNEPKKTLDPSDIRWDTRYLATPGSSAYMMQYVLHNLIIVYSYNNNNETLPDNTIFTSQAEAQEWIVKQITPPRTWRSILCCCCC